MKTLPPKLFHCLGWNTQGDLGPWTFYTSKDKGLVWFIQAPPLEPPTYLQLHRRNRWRLAARSWSTLSPQDRVDWQTAAYRCYLKITGYNLFIYSQLVYDPRTIQTVRRQSGIDLITDTMIQ